VIDVALAKCEVCSSEIWPQLQVTLNGRHVHAACFSKALREFEFKPANLIIFLAPTMDPMLAYRLGQSYVATIVRSRSRVKKR
jgi:hypothetical protein